MRQNHPVIAGTIVLTLAGVFSRFIGFYNRIFLSRTIGAKELGIYQMIFPIYLFCFAICCQGFEVGLSRVVAAQKALYKNGNIYFLLKAISIFCVSLASLLSLLMFFFSDLISIYILKTPSTSVCLKIAAIGLPFIALKGCLHGYLIGEGNYSIPSIVQLVEQVFRVGSIIIIAYSILYVKCNGAKLAVSGMVIGDIISCLAKVFLTRKQLPKKKAPEDGRFFLISHFFYFSLPLTANRICLTLLQSLEAILIPKQLFLFYGDHSTALELYGILTGITLPFLLFPSTLTNSLATMLLPSVSADYEKKNFDHLERSVNLTTYGGFFLGLGFTSIFFFFGPLLGNLIFHSSPAGQCLRMLSFLCPALYLSSLFTSILNGLGKTNKTFLHNIISIAVRLLFAYFILPDFGLDGYFIGLLLSAFLLTLLNYTVIKKTIGQNLQEKRTSI